MDKTKIFEILQANPACHLATVEGNQPRVRGMLIYRADADGIIFHTGAFKDLHKQLLANPQVELCFNDMQSNVQLRLSGTASLLEDLNLKQEIVKNRPFLQPFVDSNGYEPLAVFRVTGLTASVWTMETNFEPKQYIALT